MATTTEEKGLNAPTAAPTDLTPNTPKANESAKLADGGGAPVFMNTPLVRGIPVVVPVNEGTIEDKYLVEGVALAAPVVSGTPEMISNAQAEYAVENPTWKKGDIVAIHHTEGNSVAEVEVVNGDGAKETKRFTADVRHFNGLSKALAEGGSKGAVSFLKEHLVDAEIKDEDDFE